MDVGKEELQKEPAFKRFLFSTAFPAREKHDHRYLKRSQRRLWLRKPLYRGELAVYSDRLESMCDDYTSSKTLFPAFFFFFFFFGGGGGGGGGGGRIQKGVWIQLL